MVRARSRRRSPGQLFNLSLRVIIPVGFAALTAVNVIGLVQEGPKTKATGPVVPAAAAQVKLATVGEVGADESAQQTLRQMADQRPDLYLGLGDLSYAGVGSEHSWCTMVRDQIGPVAPFEIAAGESEEDGSHDGRISAYASCLPDRMNAVGQYASQYYLDMGTIARVIVISPNLTVNGTTFSYGRNDPEYGWLGNAIDSAHDAGIVWVVVAMNEDCISAGIYYCNISQDLLSLMINKHVDLVLSAHDHTYQRSRQILAPAPGCPEVLIDSFNPRCVANDRRDGPFHRRGGTIFTVVGSGSNNLYPINQRQPDAPYLAATMGKNKQPDPGFLLLTLSKASINGRFVRTGGGTFADQFTVSSSTASAARTSNAARPPASAGGVKRPGVAA